MMRNPAPPPTASRVYAFPVPLSVSIYSPPSTCTPLSDPLFPLHQRHKATVVSALALRSRPEPNHRSPEERPCPVRLFLRRFLALSPAPRGSLQFPRPPSSLRCRSDAVPMALLFRTQCHIRPATNCALTYRHPRHVSPWRFRVQHTTSVDKNVRVYSRRTLFHSDTYPLIRVQCAHALLQPTCRHRRNFRQSATQKTFDLEVLFPPGPCLTLPPPFLSRLLSLSSADAPSLRSYRLPRRFLHSSAPFLFRLNPASESPASQRPPPTSVSAPGHPLRL